MILVALSHAAPITVVAVGDVLPHRRVKSSAKQGWSTVFGPVSDRIRSADVAFANLESPIAPDAHQGIHGEVFNAPATLAPGLAEAGFDVLSMANNHVWDQGVAGMLETHARVTRAGMLPFGAGKTCEAAMAPVVTTVRGLKIGWVAVVDLLNADLRKGAESPCVHVAGPRCTENCGPDRDALFFKADHDALAAWVTGAKAEVDLLIVSAHWGDEYRRTPLPEYETLASTLVGAGADVVLGHHPHVLQPIRWVTAKERRGLVAYSLGNFVSDMGKSYDPATSAVRRGDTRDGVLLWLSIDPETRQITPHVESVWTDNQPTKIQVVPSAKVPLPLRASRRQRVTDVIGTEVPHRE